MKIDETVLNRMHQFLDFAVKRQELITSNLANSETPGYRTKEIRFEDFLTQEVQGQGKLRQTREEHLPGRPVLARARKSEAASGDTLGNDRNDVDMDRELSQLAENVMKFSVVGRLVQLKLQAIRTAVREGRA